MKDLIPNSKITQFFFILLLTAAVVLIFIKLQGFFSGFLGALCLYVLLVKPLNWMVFKWKWKPALAAVALMIASLAVVVTPLILLVNIVTKRVGDLIKDRDHIQHMIKDALIGLQKETGIDILNVINLHDITGFIFKIAHAVLETSVSGIVQIGVAYLLLYFMLVKNRQLETWFYRSIPLKNQILANLHKDLRSLVISNALGVPVVAVLQSIIAYGGYIIFKLPNPFEWFFLTIFAAMLPIVGASLVWWPAVIYLLATGHSTEGILLMIYCFVLVGGSDSVFRFLIQKVMADVPPLVTIFGVVLGVGLFGFIGIIFGPIFLSLVIWMFKIYQEEYGTATAKDFEGHKEEV